MMSDPKFRLDDIESYVYSILVQRSKELLKSENMYLEGFDHIIERSPLYLEKLNAGIDVLSAGKKKYSEVADINFLNYARKFIDKGVLEQKSFPINDDFHFSFWIWKYLQNKDSDKCIVYYAPADRNFSYLSKKRLSRKNKNSNYIIGKPYLFSQMPLLDLRISAIYEGSVAPKIVSRNGIDYNVLNAFNNVQDPQVLIDSYAKMNYLITFSKVDNKKLKN